MNQNSKMWLLRTAKIANRSSRSIYSYLFYPNQYSKFFELACEELFSKILDEFESQGVGIMTAGMGSVPNLQQFEKVDWEAEKFDPFGVGS